MKLYNKNKIDYLLLFLLIMISGNPLYSGATMIIITFILSALVFLNRKCSFDKVMFSFLLLLVLLTFIQAMVFSFFSIVTTLGLMMKIFSAYFIVKILKESFLEKYIKIIYILSLISIILYIVANININFLLTLSINTSGVESFYPRYSFLGIYTIITDSVSRNGGPFWEPGAFAGYIIIAFVANFIKTSRLNSKVSITLLLSLLTTFSTTGYFAMFLFLFFIFYKKINNYLLKLLSITILIITAYIAYVNLGFLGNKIESQYIKAKNLDPYRESSNSQRFLSMMRDEIDIKGYELTGRGWHSSTRYPYDPEHQIRTVGLTDILVKMGLPFFILMMIMLYRSLQSYVEYYKNNSKMYSMGFFLVVLTMLGSEVYFNFPIYWSLMFLSFVYKSPKEVKT